MTLLERLNIELDKHDLEFKPTNEYATKFTGVLIDKPTQTEMKFTIDKCLQTNFIKSFSEFCRNYADLYLTTQKIITTQ